MINLHNHFRQNPESQAAQLAVIAGFITTLGDALATIAAALAMQEAEQSPQTNPDVNYSQKQIDDLYKEINQLKKFLKGKVYSFY